MLFGFTLIELIVVIAIIAILAAILIPRFSGFTDKANQTQATVNAKQVATAIDSFYAEKNAWPAAGTPADVTAIADLSGISAAAAGTDGFVLGTTGAFGIRATVGSTPYFAGRAAAANSKVVNSASESAAETAFGITYP